MKRRGFFKSIAAGVAGVVVGGRARAEQTVVTHLKLDTTEFDKGLKALSKRLEETKAAVTMTCGTSSDATCIHAERCVDSDTVPENTRFSPSCTFTGIIDDATYYRRSLTEIEINGLFQEKKGGRGAAPIPTA